jgi:hypothetical protein
MIGVGVVGYGYWGPNLVRNFAEAAEPQIVGVSDLRPTGWLWHRTVIRRFRLLRIMRSCSLIPAAIPHVRAASVVVHVAITISYSRSRTDTLGPCSAPPSSRRSS